MKAGAIRNSGTVYEYSINVHTGAFVMKVNDKVVEQDMLSGAEVNERIEDLFERADMGEVEIVEY